MEYQAFMMFSFLAYQEIFRRCLEIKTSSTTPFTSLRLVLCASLPKGPGSHTYGNKLIVSDKYSMLLKGPHSQDKVLTSF
jgi:hypothetical protein